MAEAPQVDVVDVIQSKVGGRYMLAVEIARGVWDAIDEMGDGVGVDREVGQVDFEEEERADFERTKRDCEEEEEGKESDNKREGHTKDATAIHLGRFRSKTRKYKMCFLRGRYANAK